MTNSRTLPALIRITGDTGIPDATVIARLNDLIAGSDRVRYNLEMLPTYRHDGNQVVRLSEVTRIVNDLFVDTRNLRVLAVTNETKGTDLDVGIAKTPAADVRSDPPPGQSQVEQPQAPISTQPTSKKRGKRS